MRFRRRPPNWTSILTSLVGATFQCPACGTVGASLRHRRAAEGGVPTLVLTAEARGGRDAARSGLGADAHVLPVPAGPLGPSVDEQPDRVALCGLAAADRRRQTVQARGLCHRGHLEDAAGRPAAVPADERLEVGERGLS